MLLNECQNRTAKTCFFCLSGSGGLMLWSARRQYWVVSPLKFSFRVKLNSWSNGLGSQSGSLGHTPTAASHVACTTMPRTKTNPNLLSTSVVRWIRDGFYKQNHHGLQTSSTNESVFGELDDEWIIFKWCHSGCPDLCGHCFSAHFSAPTIWPLKVRNSEVQTVAVSSSQHVLKISLVELTHF